MGVYNGVICTVYLWLARSEGHNAACTSAPKNMRCYILGFEPPSADSVPHLWPGHGLRPFQVRGRSFSMAPISMAHTRIRGTTHVACLRRESITPYIARPSGSGCQLMSIPSCAATLDCDYPLSSACLAAPTLDARIMHTRRSIVAVFGHRLYEFSVDVVSWNVAVYQSHGAAHDGIGNGLPAG